MSAEDAEHSPTRETAPTDQVPDFESAALAVQNCLARCKIGLAKVDVFCGTVISVQFSEAEKIYSDILCHSKQGSAETENKDSESETQRDDNPDIKKLLAKLEEGIMGVGAAVVAENSKLKAELGTVLPHIQSVIQSKEEDIRTRISGTGEVALDGSEQPQHIANSSEGSKDEGDSDISTIKLFKECASILSILGAVSNPVDLHFNQMSGEYLKSIAEILDFVQDKVHDRRPKTETELQEHYTLLNELSTLIDKVEILGDTLGAGNASTELCLV
ncbi:hypothetical protein D9619_013404 [Psilocybe cf. subviscida]|uniref:Uncharacterized protein n=1 Tax=Psilocybe cf. subviscida TaxID=2480587 RepID=A0A8H5F9L1_9AGAR|nr:hypothetical protein D9619_013404 [Psilocybe cf. subviscida]